MIEWVKERLPNMALQEIVEVLLDEELAENEEEYYGTDNMTAILIVFKN
jgi:serine/threonine protein phosphatase PrpC